MKTNEIIDSLRRLSRSGSQYRRAVCRLAADRLEELERKHAKSVAEPAHGHWIPQYEYDFDACIDRVTGYTCSQCGKWSVEAGEECPNCYARMRGAEDGK